VRAEVIQEEKSARRGCDAEEEREESKGETKVKAKERDPDEVDAEERTVEKGK
jgi:hypothetical protein